ncbi:SUMO-specific isopeptidase USPL1-like [Clytia hemisphaerica]|uniref:Ubiquitin-specific peptidase-like SUMO isopeptidase domain-containing protein n=1 Tax=Clytia hemisphaerica TaxID=252671 RepID=A0A7M5V928_9CNID
MVVMAVNNRYCSDCLESGEFLPLRLVMMNLDSGLWMCPKDDCTFPLSSPSMQLYMEEDLTTERVLLLTGNKSKQLERPPTPDSLVASISSNKQSDMLQQTQYAVSTTSSSGSRKRKHSDGGSSSRSTKTNSFRSVSNSNITDPISSDSSSLMANKKYPSVPLWENEELLCWLDSMLALIVLNQTLQNYPEESKGTLNKLLSEYKHNTDIYNVTKDYETIRASMHTLRKSTLNFIQPKMLSSFTEEDSPLLSLQLLMKTNAELYEDCEVEYSSKFTCNQCQFEKTDGFKKTILTLPEGYPDLNFVENLYYKRNCYKCNAPEQKNVFYIEKYPAALFVYCSTGVGCRKYWNWFNFTSPAGDNYIVTQIVQYSRKKHHFILWSYSYKDKLWIEADDLKHPVVQYQHERPKCRSHEVHFMVLEKVSTLEEAIKKNEQKNLSSEQTGSESAPVTPESLESPLCSGNSSVIVQYSGQSSRKTSLCSSDGILPNGRLSNDSDRPIEGRKDSGELPNDQLRKKSLLHVPYYKPFTARSKQTARESPTNYNQNATSSHLKSESSSMSHSTPAKQTVLNNPDILQQTTKTSDIKADPTNAIFSQALANELGDFYSDLLDQQSMDTTQEDGMFDSTQISQGTIPNQMSSDQFSSTTQNQQQDSTIDVQQTLERRFSNDVDSLSDIVDIGTAIAGGSFSSTVSNDKTGFKDYGNPLKRLMEEEEDIKGVFQASSVNLQMFNKTETNDTSSSGSHVTPMDINTDFGEIKSPTEDEPKVDFAITMSTNSYSGAYSDVKLSDEELEEILNG